MSDEEFSPFEDENDEVREAYIKARKANVQFYENEFPEEGEYVVCEIVDINSAVGVRVKLLEYDNKIGLIQFREVSNSRYRGITKTIKVKKKEICVVTGVDKQQGYIDLSRKRAELQELLANCKARYQNALKVNSIVMNVAVKTEGSMQSMYERFIWPLNKKYGQALFAFAKSLPEVDSLFEGYDLNDEEKENFKSLIISRLTPKSVKIRADFELRCTTYEGVDAIREALIEAETFDESVSVSLVAPPRYFASLKTSFRDVGIENLTKAVEKIRESIEISGGTFIMWEAPRVMTSKEEETFRKQLLEIEKRNQDVDDDEISEDSYEY